MTRLDRAPSGTQRRIQASRPTFTNVPEILADVQQVLTSGRLMLGPKLEALERAFAEYVGCRYAIGVSSCTAALEIVLRFLNVQGREVVVPTNTFVATANAVRYAGAAPVFADINPETFCLSADTLRRALTPRTSAVIVVHVAGLVAPDIEAIRALCRERGVALVEDCAHAHGASFDGARAGAFGTAGCFSFYPTKLLTTGSGGMITTNDEALNAYARLVRVHGRPAEAGDQGDPVDELGNDWFLDEVRSVLGLHQLRHLESQLATRRSLAQEYVRLLTRIPDAAPLVSRDARCAPSHYKFIVVLPADVSVPRLKAALRERHQIEAEYLYLPPCHLQPLYQRLLGSGRGRCPAAEAILPRHLCLPLHGAMSADDVAYVVACLEEELQDVRAPLARSP